MNGFADRGLDEGDFAQSSSGIISSFDAFPKVKRTYRTATNNGDIWTIILVLFCCWLTSTEFWRWMEGETTTHFSVEKGVSHDLQINIDVVIPMQCDDLHINVQDASGDRIMASEMLQKDATRWDVWKTGMVVEKDGLRRRRDETHAPFWMMQEAHQFKQQADVHNYLRLAKMKRHWSTTPPLGRRQKADSCRIYGSVESNKVQGDFHITARGHGYPGVPQEHLEHSQFNFSHHINELSFGPYFPSINQPLDNAQSTTTHNFYKYQYFLSIVPTIYTDAKDHIKTSTPPNTVKRIAREKAAIAAKNAPPKPPLTDEELNEQEDREEERRRRRRGGEIQQMMYRMHGIDPNQPSNPNEPDVARDRREDEAFFSNPFVSRHTVFTNQYAVTEQSHAINEQNIPGIFFKYDIEPILLTVSEEWGGLLGLGVRCVNVVAGILVAGGWIVALIEWGAEMVSRRRRRASSAGGLIFGGQSEKGSVD